MRNTPFDTRASEWIGDMTVWRRQNDPDNAERLDRLRRNLRRAREALEAHSWHGPYSRQRVSRLVEESVAAVGGTCEAVVDRPEGEVQPFVATYMDWLEETHGLSWGEPMPLALFHQASNGGVRCDVDGWTRVPGLYAAGEVAPVFAVDRLGGIASAVQEGWNGLTQGAQQALDSLGDQLNTMIDTLAVMIVTSCLIPLLVLILFLQLVKIITGLDFGGATAVMGAARTKGRAVASSLRRPVQKG